MQISRNFLSGVVASSAILGLSSAARAQLPAFPAFSTTGSLAGNQSWGGLLGSYFTVTGPQGLTIRDIGVFDSGADGIMGVGTTLQVAIFTQAGVQVTATETFTQALPGSLGAGSYRFRALPSDLLLPSGNYVIVAQGFNASDMNYNHKSLGGSSPINTGEFAFQGNNIVWGGSYYDHPTTLQVPGILDDAAPNLYGAGVFTVMIPEPGTFALLGLGLAPIALAIRRRRK